MKKNNYILEKKKRRCHKCGAEIEGRKYYCAKCKTQNQIDQNNRMHKCLNCETMVKGQAKYCDICKKALIIPKTRQCAYLNCTEIIAKIKNHKYCQKHHDLIQQQKVLARKRKCHHCGKAIEGKNYYCDACRKLDILQKKPHTRKCHHCGKAINKMQYYC